MSSAASLAMLLNEALLSYMNVPYVNKVVSHKVYLPACCRSACIAHLHSILVLWFLINLFRNTRQAFLSLANNPYWEYIVYIQHLFSAMVPVTLNMTHNAAMMNTCNIIMSILSAVYPSCLPAGSELWLKDLQQKDLRTWSWTCLRNSSSSSRVWRLFSASTCSSVSLSKSYITTHRTFNHHVQNVLIHSLSTCTLSGSRQRLFGTNISTANKQVRK